MEGIYLHHTEHFETDEQTKYIDYTVYMLVGMMPTKVIVPSYVPLTIDEIKTKANDKLFKELLHRAPSI